MRTGRRSRGTSEHSLDEADLLALWCSVLQCVAVCCSVLQCVAVCCSVFDDADLFALYQHHIRLAFMSCVVLCCGVLRCVAVCGNVLQTSHHVMPCSVLQCVSVWRSVLQYGAVCRRPAIMSSECISRVSVCLVCVWLSSVSTTLD